MPALIDNYPRRGENPMSKSNLSDGAADAIAATAIMSVVIIALYFWLSGMPG